MPSDSFEQLLDRTASWFGIDGGFWDIFGDYHTTSVAAKQAILRALGVAADSAADLEQALGALARNEWERLRGAAVVAGENGPMEVPLHVPADSLGQRACFVVRREDGESSEFELNLRDLPQAASAEMDGRTWVRAQVTLPMQLPLGYHQVTVSVGGSHASTRCIVTPERAYMDPHLGRDGRGGNRRQPVRRALASQLGMRRFPRPEKCDRLGGGRTGGEFRLAESAARDPQPASVQHQPLPAELHFLPELPLPGCGE